MTTVILLLTLGGWLVYSALKGQSLVESLTGKGGDTLDAHGGTFGGGDFPVRGGNDLPSGASRGKYGFQGPYAAQLDNLANIAVTRFHLTIGQVCRPANASYGAANSLHKSCRAFDVLGAVADRVAFSNYVATLSWVDENFCDQAGRSASGFEHTSHGHVGA